jgi:predicted nicotinamide N-methyase
MVVLSFGAWLLLLTATSAWSNRKLPSRSQYRATYGKLAVTDSNSEDAPSSPSNNVVRLRQKILIDEGKKASILSRTVPITADWNITVWEWEKPAAVIETFWQVENQGLALTGYSPQARQVLLDPFGLVCWPGAVVAAQELLRCQHLIRNKRVLVLGAGVGIEAQAAAVLGASSVIATDIHPTTLKLLEYGAEQAGLSHKIETCILDLFAVQDLPECDVVIVADVLYNERLATQVARRCLQARERQPPALILVSDSQRFVANFEPDLNDRLRRIGQPLVYWENRWLAEFRGSGVLIDTDQTYDVKARVIWIGL